MGFRVDLLDPLEGVWLINMDGHRVRAYELETDNPNTTYLDPMSDQDKPRAMLDLIAGGLRAQCRAHEEKQNAQ